MDSRIMKTLQAVQEIIDLCEANKGCDENCKCPLFDGRCLFQGVETKPREWKLALNTKISLK